MSDATRPDLDAILARMERDLAEAPKLRAESEKFIAEQRKLIAESQKLERERGMMPWQVVVTALGAGAAPVRGRRRLRPTTWSLTNGGVALTGSAFSGSV